jgi:hypothetical protein
MSHATVFDEDRAWDRSKEEIEEPF